jgi:hypothetical protein
MRGCAPYGRLVTLKVLRSGQKVHGAQREVNLCEKSLDYEMKCEQPPQSAPEKYQKKLTLCQDMIFY